jgi:hypothetical protein
MSEEKVSKKAAPRKGTKETETVIGSAVGSLRKTVDLMDTAMKQVKGLAEEAEKQQGLIAQNELRLGELDVEYGEKKRALEVELKNNIAESKEKAVATILAEQGCVAVKEADYKKIQEDLTYAKTNLQAEISKAVGAALGHAKKEHENEVKLKEADWKTKEAENAANLKAKDIEITSLKGQVDMWSKALEAERTAGVERAKAAAVGTINVGTNKN